jgi:hypothetical protein
MVRHHHAIYVKKNCLNKKLSSFEDLTSHKNRNHCGKWFHLRSHFTRPQDFDISIQKKKEELKKSRNGVAATIIQLNKIEIKTAGHFCKMSRNTEYINGTRIFSFKARHSSIILSL